MTKPGTCTSQPCHSGMPPACSQHLQHTGKTLRGNVTMRWHKNKCLLQKLSKWTKNNCYVQFFSYLRKDSGEKVKNWVDYLGWKCWVGL